MGREANCSCTWGRESGVCKVLLEPPDIILRGEVRRKAAIASLTQLRLEREALCFSASGQPVELALGAVQSERWLKALRAPATTLAAKLAIKPGTLVCVLGEPEDPALEEAIACGALASAREADLLIAVVREADALHKAFGQWARCPQQPPIWIVYPKGRNQSINESEIRSILRGNGLIDTKVASVSAVLTALRFVHRK